MRRILSQRLRNWQQSAEWREIARQHCFKMNAERRLKQKCGATNKKDGEPCKNLAMENGRCKWHGGKSPKGKDWHKTQFPDGKSRNAVARAERKLADKRRIEKARNKRLASMTPEQRQEYEKWKNAHTPGSSTERERRRHERVSNEDLRKRLAEPRHVILSEEAATLAEERRQLEKVLQEIEALSREQQNLGVFG
ncbi:hypothetical protein EDF68_102496 [Ochrobactrum sp. BH3]|nr:hypothetical protein EDF68_102496 [Ochrobactrum sp. BH3]